MARRARDKKGRFLSKRAAAARRSRSSGRKARKNPVRRRATTAVARRRAPTRRARPPIRRRRARANPAGGNTMQGWGRWLFDASVCAFQLTIGKAASRSVPSLLNLPQNGNTGVAVRAGTSVALGAVVDAIGMRALGAKMVEGGLQGVVEDLLVGFNAPWFAASLSRPPGLGSYPRTLLSSYPRPMLSASSGAVGRYPRSGMGAYVQSPQLVQPGSVM